MASGSGNLWNSLVRNYVMFSSCTYQPLSFSLGVLAWIFSILTAVKYNEFLLLDSCQERVCVDGFSLLFGIKTLKPPSLLL